MSDDELSSWLEETIAPDKGRKKQRNQKNNSSSSPFSLVQVAILGVLVFILCAVFMAVGVTFYLNQGALLGQPQPAAALAIEQPSPAPPETRPTSTPIIEPTEPPATPTSMLPQAHPTIEPSPTATFAVAPAFINKDKISYIIHFVERWRGLALPENIPINFLTRRQLREQWQDESFDAATLEAVQIQQEFYAALGLIEPEVDLVEAVLTSQTNILLGYYTPEEKAMVVIAESVMMFAEEETTFAHEYVHALQDYHFDLSSLLTYQDKSGDAFLAARSLPEGDARLVEDLFTNENITQAEIDYTIYRYLFHEQPPALEGVSPALGIFTFFPYTAGEYFAIYLFIEGGYSWELVNRAYSHPPQSTEQILHPEKYLADEIPIEVTVPNLAPALGQGWRELDRNVLGEAGFLVWLVDKTDDQTALDGAAGWDGDTYTLWVNDNHQRVLAEHSVWESESEAAEFMDAFTTYMNLREGENSGPDTGLWRSERGVTMITRSAEQVLIIIAPNRQIAGKVRNQFVEF